MCTGFSCIVLFEIILSPGSILPKIFFRVFRISCKNKEQAVAGVSLECFVQDVLKSKRLAFRLFCICSNIVEQAVAVAATYAPVLTSAAKVSCLMSRFSSNGTCRRDLGAADDLESPGIDDDT